MVPLTSVARVIVVVTILIVNGTVALLLVLAPDADWVTFIVVEPPVFGKTIFPHMSATAELPIV